MENPQGETPLAEDEEMVFLACETDEAAPTAMAENAAQAGSSLLSESARELRRREKSRLQSPQMVEPRSEIERRRVAAATEHYMTKGSDRALSFRALARKHGLQHHEEITRQVKRMKHLEESFSLAQEFAEEAAQIVSAEQESTLETSATKPGEPEQESYKGCGKPRKVYAAAVQHACVLMESKGWGAGKATREANSKFGVSLKSNSVKQHFRSHGAAEPKEQGRPTAITAADEERMVQTILLM